MCHWVEHRLQHRAVALELAAHAHDAGHRQAGADRTDAEGAGHRQLLLIETAGQAGPVTCRAAMTKGAAAPSTPWSCSASTASARSPAPRGPRPRRAAARPRRPRRARLVQQTCRAAMTKGAAARRRRGPARPARLRPGPPAPRGPRPRRARGADLGGLGGVPGATSSTRRARMARHSGSRASPACSGGMPWAWASEMRSSSAPGGWQSCRGAVLGVDQVGHQPQVVAHRAGGQMAQTRGARGEHAGALGQLDAGMRLWSSASISPRGRIRCNCVSKKRHGCPPRVGTAAVRPVRSGRRRATCPRAS